MRAVRRAFAAWVRGGDWRWMVPLAALSGLLTYLFGWMGYCAALGVAIVLRHRILALSQRNRGVLHSVEAWYYDDDAGDAR